MTAIVGVLCKDGIVIGADSSATFAAGTQRTIEQKCKKVFIVHDRVIIACTGQIGLAQRFTDCVTQLWGASAFRSKAALQIARELCKAGVEDFATTRANQGQIGGLVAFPTKSTWNLCEFASLDFQPELKTDHMWFVTMGSGQQITDPFLALLKRVFWNTSQPSVSEGTFAVAWTLDHVIRLNPGGIDGPAQIAVLAPAKPGDDPMARLLTDSEIAEHMDSVKGAETYLRKYREILAGGNSPPIPSPPKPV